MFESNCTEALVVSKIAKSTFLFFAQIIVCVIEGAGDAALPERTHDSMESCHAQAFQLASQLWVTAVLLIPPQEGGTCTCLTPFSTCSHGRLAPRSYR